MKKEETSENEDFDGGYIYPAGSPCPFKVVTTEELAQELERRRLEKDKKKTA